MTTQAEKIEAAAINAAHLQHILDITKDHKLCTVETELLDDSLVRIYYFEDGSNIITTRDMLNKSR